MSRCVGSGHTIPPSQLLPDVPSLLHKGDTTPLGAMVCTPSRNLSDHDDSPSLSGNGLGPAPDVGGYIIA